MEENAIEHLVHEFEQAVAAHDEPFDGSGDWRSRVNTASTRMVVISREIAAAGPAAIGRFARLVAAPERRVSLHAAHHLLDFMDPDPATRDAAMLLIQDAATGDGAEAAAERLWIESLRAEGQDE